MTDDNANKPWQCYSCLLRIKSLDKGFNTTCPQCGSYEIHLYDRKSK